MAVNPAPFGFSAEYRGDQREEMARGFKKFKPELEKVLSKPITKVWPWH
jgi:hypothetical protein